MKTGFFLTARLGSTRLPRKHLLEVSGTPFLAVLAKRILHSFGKDISSDEALLAIVTSDEAMNHEFERFVPLGIRVFYGAKENIPLRHLQAAKQFGVDAVVAVDGDDILCSTNAMRAVRDGLIGGNAYVKTSGLPLGMNAFGYRRNFLAASLIGNENKRLETGWNYIFDSSRLVDYPLELGLDTPPSLRFTLDYPEDYEFFKAISEHFGDEVLVAGDREIVRYVLTQGLQKLTDPVSGKYWEDFKSVQTKEMREGGLLKGGAGHGFAR